MNVESHIKLGELTLNLTEMGNDLGISLSHLSRIFSGNRTPSISVARKIVEYLDISLDDLFIGIDKNVRSQK